MPLTLPNMMGSKLLHSSEATVPTPSSSGASTPSTFKPLPLPDLENQTPPPFSSSAADDLPFTNLPFWRKCVILTVTSWMTLVVTFSSTALFSALPEISSDLGTNKEVLNASNAGVLLAMGISTLIWGPISLLTGRRTAYLAATLILAACSIGTAFAPNLPTFVALRILGGLQGTFFMVAGQTIIADTFSPISRGTAVGCFMAGSVIGPALGPCLGGVIVTYTTWHTILWLQTAMAAFGFILAFFFIPSLPQAPVTVTEDKTKINSKPPRMFSPISVVKILHRPNVFLTDLTCGFLSWNQYSLLTAPRYLINPRFHLDTPLVSGLFFIAPGFGFLIGSIIGGKFADRTVKQHIVLRGHRLPQDRLNSSLGAFFIVFPIGALVYGWSLQETVGGLWLPIISIFFAGFGLMAAFSSLNTYSAEVMPARRTEVMAGKYLVQYLFAAGGSAGVLPMIQSIGVGLTTTIGVVLVIVGGVLVILTARYGLDMQIWSDKRTSSSGEH